MDKVQVLQQFQRMYHELNVILCEFDPYGLSDKGRIADEFDEEAWQILYGLIDTNSMDEVIDMVTTVFVTQFCTADFNREQCKDVAEHIYHWWQRQ
jgi:hypothetical protein